MGKIVDSVRTTVAKFSGEDIIVILAGVLTIGVIIYGIFSIATSGTEETQVDERNELIEYLPKHCQLGQPFMIEWTGERTYPHIRYDVICEEGVTP